MSDLFTKIKRRFIEPKIFAVVARTRSLSLLHVDVHYTLEEAFNAAKKKLHDALSDNKKGEHIEMFLFNSLSTEYFLPKFYGENATDILLPVMEKKDETGAVAELPFNEADLLNKVTESKNDLVKTIIDEKNLDLLESVKRFLTVNEIRFIKDKIKAGKNEK